MHSGQSFSRALESLKLLKVASFWSGFVAAKITVSPSLTFGCLRTVPELEAESDSVLCERLRDRALFHSSLLVLLSSIISTPVSDEFATDSDVQNLDAVS